MTASFAGDLRAVPKALPHFWEHTVGSGHATLALRADWQAQLRRTHAELGMTHVRFHGLLSDDMGTLVGEGETLFYSFFNADPIVDFLLSIGMKQFVELSFMPSILASGTQTVFQYRACVTPLKDYVQWAALIRKLVRHWVERYGAQEVRQWFFEVWNEPNLTAFGSGKQSEYFELYRYTVDAIKLVRGAGRATVVLTNFALPLHPIATESVCISLQGCAEAATKATTRRIDLEHANAKRRWKQWGKSDYLSGSMVAERDAASRLHDESQPVIWQEGTLRLDVTMPPQSVAAVEFAC